MSEGTLPFELQAARLSLADRRPYLAALLYSLVPVERALGMLGPKPSLGVDRYHRLYYNKDVANIWTHEELVAVLYHEVNHLLRSHPDRAVSYHADDAVFNIAGDFEINDDIDEEENHTFTLPLPHLHPKNEKWATGLMAEEYYELVMAQAKKRSKGQSQGQGEKGSEGGASSGRGRGAGNQQRVKGGQVQTSPANGNCGSCARGEKQEWEEDGPGGQGKDGKPTPNGVSAAERDLINRKVAQDIQDFDPNSEGSRGRGDVPGWMKRWAKEKLNPQVPWQRVLAGIFRKAVADVQGLIDFTYRRPARRMAANPDFVLPAFRRPLPKIVFVVDTSGSISNAMLAQDLSEIAEVLKTVGLYEGITVMSVDHAVGTCKKVMNTKQIDLVGGGGTDMGIGLKHASELRPKPDIVIVLTDGITPWPKDPPKGFKTVIIIMGKHAMPTPPWAKVLVIEDPHPQGIT